MYEMYVYKAMSVSPDILVLTFKAVDWCPAQATMAIIIITVPHCQCVTGAVVGSSY